MLLTCIGACQAGVHSEKQNRGASGFNSIPSKQRKVWPQSMIQAHSMLNAAFRITLDCLEPLFVQWYIKLTPSAAL